MDAEMLCDWPVLMHIMLLGTVEPVLNGHSLGIVDLLVQVPQIRGIIKKQNKQT